jgi:hypothetical protein
MHVRRLRQQPDRPRPRAPVERLHVDPVERRRALIRPAQRGETGEQRALARTVRAEQRGHPPAPKGEAHVVEHPVAAERQSDPLGRESGHASLRRIAISR